MRRAIVRVNGLRAGVLAEEEPGRLYTFEYDDDYGVTPVSLTMPLSTRTYTFDRFPPFFDGLLPEGVQLDSLLRLRKLDRTDYLGQLIIVGADLVGAVTVEAEP